MQLQVTQTMLSPSGTPSETPSMTQPCLPSARKNTDWFEAHWGEMEPVAEAKRKALLDYKQNPWPNTRDARLSRPPAALPTRTGKLSAPRSSLPPTAVTPEGCTRGSKLPLAPLASKQPCSNPRLARPSPTRASKLQRWVEHYLELYAKLNIATDVALDALPGLPVMEELDHLPTEGDLVRRSGLFEILQKIGCPPKLLAEHSLL